MKIVRLGKVLIRVQMLVLVFMLLFTSHANAAYKYLNIPEYQSGKACWSACAAHVTGYYNGKITWSDLNYYETKIYEDKYGVGAAGGKGGTVDDIVTGVSNYSWIDGFTTYSYLTYSELKSEINNLSPVVAALTDYYNNGWDHAITIRGYNDDSGTQYDYYSDPYDGSYYRVTHSFLVNDWQWIESAYWQQ